MQVAASQKSIAQMLLNHFGCNDFQSKARIAESVICPTGVYEFLWFPIPNKNTDSLDF